MEELKKIVNGIYIELQIKNHDLNIYSIPEASIFNRDMAQKFNLHPESVSELMNILERSNKIFIINIVKEDLAKKISRLDGYVVTEGNTLQKICKAYEDELKRLYIIEFNKRQNIENILKDILPEMDKYNNTSIGRNANIIYNLEIVSFKLEKEILKYSKAKQQKKLEEELKKIGTFADFLNKFVDAKIKQKTPVKKVDSKKPVSEKRSQKKQTVKNHIHFEIDKKYSIEKILSVYGIDFYSRVCFRDYQFSLLLKLIEDRHITSKEDLLVVKKQLQRARLESDKDVKLQEYAAEINSLERCINNKLQFL